MIFPNTQLFATVGFRMFAVESWEHVSRAYRALLDDLGLGASNAPNCLIVDTRGQTLAHVSYNGRVWTGAWWQEDSECLYTPN